MATIKLREVNPVVFDNNVGLGDTNPNEKLVLNNGNIRLQSYNAGQGLIFKSTSTSGNWATIKFIQPDSTPTWQIIVDEAGNKTNDFKIVSGAATKVFHMNSIGTIGMGVNAPRSHLHIGGARGGSIALTNSTIGDGPSDGSDIYASTDEHLHIQNRQASGGIIFRTNGNEGLFINNSQNVSIGVADLDSSEFSHLTPHSRCLIHKSGIGDNVTQGMLHLWGKFTVSTLGNGEEFLSHRVTFENSTGSIKRSFSPIQFSHNDSKIDTYLNKDNGSVKIGPGSIATSNGLLEVANNGLNVETMARFFAKNADCFLSFGDNRKNWAIGADYDKQQLAIISESTLQATGGIYMDAGGYVGLGTAGAALDCSLKVKSADNQLADFHSTDTDAYIKIQDSNDSLYIGSDNGIGSFGGTTGAHTNNLSIDLASGNVGIGTGDHVGGPTHKLEIKGPGSGADVLNIHKQSGTGGIRFTFNGTNYVSFIRTYESSTLASNYMSLGVSQGNTTAGAEVMRLTGDGKIKVGSTAQTPIRHIQDNVEANTTVPICTVEDHANDKVIYNVSLSAIEAGDIIMCNVNFGLSSVSTAVYNPNINFALILGKTEYTDFGDAVADYSTVMDKHVAHLTDTRVVGYGGDVTSSGMTAYSTSADYGGVNSGPIANDDTTTMWAVGSKGAHSWWVDLGSGNSKTVTQLKLKPMKSKLGGGWGGVKNFTVGGSNDASSWTTLYSSIHPNNEDWATYQWANSQSFRYYRIYCADGWVSDDWVAISEIELMEASAGSGVIFPFEQHLGGMYTITADDVTAGRETVNFIVWAHNSSAQASCVDNLAVSDTGSLDVLHIKGALSS